METREKLKQFGNIPITKDILVSILGEYKSPMQKLVTLEKRGDLMRIKRDLYVVTPIVTNKKIVDNTTSEVDDMIKIVNLTKVFKSRNKRR